MGSAVADLSGKRVLLTGSNGFIGRHVMAEGKRLGADLHAIELAGQQAPGVVYHIVDLTDRQRVFDTVGTIQPEAVIHLAAAGVVRGQQTFQDLLAINVAGTDNLLAAVAATGVRPPVMIAGSGYEYGVSSGPIPEDALLAPSTEYGVSKAAASLCAGLYAKTLPITLLRFFNVYGPGEPSERLVPYIVSCAARGQVAEVTPCEQIRDFVYVVDLAQLVWQVLAQSPSDPGLGIYNVGSGSAVVLKDFISLVVAALREQGLEARIAFGARPYRPGEPMVYVADTAKLRRHFHWNPRTSLEDGVRYVVEAAL